MSNTLASSSMALPHSPRHPASRPNPTIPSLFSFAFLPFPLVVAGKPAHELPRFALIPPSSPPPIQPEPASPSSTPRRRWRRLQSQFRGSEGGPERPARASWKETRRWRLFFASRKVRGIILLHVVALIYASNIPVVKEVEAITDPALFSFVRFAVSAIPFLPSLFKAHRDWKTCIAGMELGLWVSLGYLAQALGLLTSDAGRASFISAFTVIVVPLIDGMFGAKVPALTWFGAFVSLIGVAMLECTGSPPSVGDILNLLSATFFGIHMLRTEHIARSTKKEKFAVLLGYEVCVIAFLSAIWFFFKGIFGNVHPLRSGSWTWTFTWNWLASFPWLPAIYTGLFSTGLCLWAELAAMRDVSATDTAIIYGLEPVWGAAFAWFFLGERWGTIGWIGAALVICGSLTVQILGSSLGRSPRESCNSQHDLFIASNEQNDFSLSTIVVNYRKNGTDLYKKRDNDI